MQPTVSILVGAPLSGREARFLRKLHAALDHSDALILANVFVRGQQVDFIVVTPTYAALLEHKYLPWALFGKENGKWTTLDAAGGRVEYPGRNPLRQAYDQKMALSDERRKFQTTTHGVPPPLDRAFYTDLEAFVCIEPQIHRDSDVTSGDHRVAVRSAAAVIDALRHRAIRSSWSLADWRRFAEEHLCLTPVSIEQATDPRALSAHDALLAYQTRLSDILGEGLPPLLDLPDHEGCGPRLIDRLSEPRNYLLLGPTGTAKTFHLHHLALALASSSVEIPIIVNSNKFRGGPFRTLLAQCTAPFSREKPKALLDAARRCGKRPVLLLDALNECPDTFVVELLRGVQAFTLHYDARVVVTSQRSATLSAEIAASTIESQLPELPQKRAIFAYHAGLEPSSELDVFCAGFTNAYDLTIAGRCHTSGVRPPSRTILYQRYVHQCLQTQTTVSMALLRRIAGEMNGLLVRTLSRDEFDDLAERFLADHRASLEALDVLRQSRLIRLTSDSFEFEHQLLLSYFQAEHLRRLHRGIESLAVELRRPRNHDLAEFVLPRFTARDDIAVLLASIEDVTLLCRICRGELGATVQDVLVERGERLLEEARVDLASITVDCEGADVGRDVPVLSHIRVASHRTWTRQDVLLLRVIALNLQHPQLQSAFLRLFDVTESTLKAMTHASAERASFAPDAAWSETVRLHSGGIQHGDVSVPCTEVLSTLRLLLMGSGRKRTLIIRDALIERALADPGSMFALAMLLEDREAAEKADALKANLAIVDRALRSGVYVLRMSAFEYLRSLRDVIDRTSPERVSAVRTMLEALTTDNPLENSERFVVLGEYDEDLKLSLTIDGAIAEFRALIVPDAENDGYVVEMADATGRSRFDCLAGQAYGCLAKIFEEVFQGIYAAAYHRLSESERCDILCLAGQSPHQGFHSNWLLMELLRLGDARALPVFRRFAVDFDAQAILGEEAVAAYVTGIEGCARWSDSPPLFRAPDSPERQSWNVIGQILFWLYRPPDENRTRTIAALWAGLTDEVALAAGDVLHHLAEASEQRGTVVSAPVDLVSSCPNEAASIAILCLSTTAPIPSVFRYGGRYAPGFTRFLIETLGEAGSESAVPVLHALADDETFGKPAINALERVRQRLRGAPSA